MKKYRNEQLSQIAFTLGGLGAGDLCLRGNGALGSVALRGRPNVGFDPLMFSALTVLGEGGASRILEAPVPATEIMTRYPESGYGLSGKTFGLPRFTDGSFSSRFPFAEVCLTDERLPVEVRLTAWSPFVASEEDSSSLPFAALEYTFENISERALDCVYYFAAENFMRVNDNASVCPIENGFVLAQPADPNDVSVQGAFAVQSDHRAGVNAAWFRGGWFDTLSMLWNGIRQGETGDKAYGEQEYHGNKSSGGMLNVAFRLEPHARETVSVRLSWYVPGTSVRHYLPAGDPAKAEDWYQPWYGGQFADIRETAAAWEQRYDELRANSLLFSDCFFDTDLPEEIPEAIAANLNILKSGTVLRLRDGRLWGYEGSGDHGGSCPGTTTHVWNYQQATAHLFPRLERSLRETEFRDSQDERGHQNFRSTLPVGTPDHGFHAASDGQLGGIVKVYREWRISGDTEWMKSLWGQVRQSLDYGIGVWDPDHEGALTKPHHNTYDIEFWGADCMCTGYYLSALKAASLMGEALGEDVFLYRELYEKGRTYLEEKLWNGEYFAQNVHRAPLEEIKACAAFAGSDYSPELEALIAEEGPRYQYGSGCLSDAVVGIWLGEMCGLSDLADDEKVKRTLASIFRYNFRADLSAHANPQRPGYAVGKEGGLLLCSWPRGGMPSLPFVYSNEVWTGIEYQAAAHLISRGMVEEGLTIIRTLRARYDGVKRNPYCEYECGYWYMRALASYGLIEAYTGVRYDAVEKTLHVSVKNRDHYRCFLSTETGFGTVVVKDGTAEYLPAYGTLAIEKTVFDA